MDWRDLLKRLLIALLIALIEALRNYCDTRRPDR